MVQAPSEIERGHSIKVYVGSVEKNESGIDRRRHGRIEKKH